MGSTATADKNRLDTGTLGFSDIKNSAEYEVEHQSAGISSGGSIGGQFAGNLANSLLAGANNSGHDEGITQSAVSNGTIIVRDEGNLEQKVADLSRDVENANGSIGPIFDKEKEQAQLIGEIGSQVGDVVRTEGAIAATRAANEKNVHLTEAELKKAEADWTKAHPGEAATKEDIQGQAWQNSYKEALRQRGWAPEAKHSRPSRRRPLSFRGWPGET